jgi:hypothetical protein
MFEGIKNGWDILKGSIKVFNKHPIFLLPLIAVWLIIASLIVFLKWFFPWEVYSDFEVFLIIFFVIFFQAFLLTFSCSILLELIQQIETGKKLSLGTAFSESIGKNLIKIIPLTFLMGSHLVYIDHYSGNNKIDF